jgi:hypothetical protein
LSPAGTEFWYLVEIFFTPTIILIPDPSPVTFALAAHCSLLIQHSALQQDILSLLVTTSLPHYKDNDTAATAQAFSYNRIGPGRGHYFSIFLSAGTNGGRVFD